MGHLQPTAVDETLNELIMGVLNIMHKIVTIVSAFAQNRQLTIFDLRRLLTRPQHARRSIIKNKARSILTNDADILKR